MADGRRARHVSGGEPELGRYSERNAVADGRRARTAGPWQDTPLCSLESFQRSLATAALATAMTVCRADASVAGGSTSISMIRSFAPALT